MGQPPQTPDGFFGRRAALGEGRFILPDPGIAACQVPQTFVCRRDGKWWLYLFYATQIGRRTTAVEMQEWFQEGSTIGFTTRSAICGKRSNDRNAGRTFRKSVGGISNEKLNLNLISKMKSLKIICAILCAGLSFPAAAGSQIGERLMWD